MLILILVSLMTSGVFAMFTYLVTLNKKIEYRAAAYKLLVSKIEDARNVNFESYTIGTVTEDANELPQGTISTTVTDNVEGSTQDDIRQITVTISWDFKGSQTSSISSYVTRGGIQR